MSRERRGRPPAIGARCVEGGVEFRVWAPAHGRVELVVETGATPRSHDLERTNTGIWALTVADAGPGTRYRYRLDGTGPFPDPASRFQPEGVHGASEVIDPRFPWTDDGWPGLRLSDLAVYELHVGTFTRAGTFEGVLERLEALKELGVTAIELMPVADFPGRRNWGYDGVDLFAPARCYGRPEDLRRLVDAAHGLGLGVLLDVVYNHLGPDGAYAGLFSGAYFSEAHRTPWGAAVNLDGPGSEHVRDFFIENACHWRDEYHVDGLRLDATHALVDDGPRHFLAELTDRVREAFPDRPPLLIAEDHRNLAHMIRPVAEGGWGLDAVWSDDFHHQVRRGLAGDQDGYFRDFTGSVADLCRTVTDGWFFQGQHSEHLGGPRGTDPGGLPGERFVVFLQNHDQIGNRAFGERLHHQIDSASYRAAAALLLAAPQTPLLFMGQEWAASAPFLYFTDHEPKLGPLVTEGRRRELAAFSTFADPAAREGIPDPQAPATFEASRLAWDERVAEPHASVLRLHQALLRLRREAPLFAKPARAVPLGDDAFAVIRGDGPESLVMILRWRGSGPVDGTAALAGLGTTWALLLDTEEPRFAPDPQAPALDRTGPAFRFCRPGAMFLRARR